MQLPRQSDSVARFKAGKNFIWDRSKSQKLGLRPSQDSEMDESVDTDMDILENGDSCEICCAWESKLEERCSDLMPGCECS